MAQYFRTLSALTEDLSLLPSTQMAAHHHLLTLVPENRASSTDLCGHQTYIHVMHICVHAREQPYT